MYFCLPQAYLTDFQFLFSIPIIFGKTDHYVLGLFACLFVCLFFVVNDVDSNETHSVESMWTVCWREEAGGEGGQMVECYLQAYWYIEFHSTFISHTSYMVPFES